MIVAEISGNVSGRWNGQLLDSDSGEPIGEPWQADSRGGLIATMLHWLPLTHIQFQDRMNPIDP